METSGDLIKVLAVGPVPNDGLWDAVERRVSALNAAKFGPFQLVLALSSPPSGRKTIAGLPLVGPGESFEVINLLGLSIGLVPKGCCSFNYDPLICKPLDVLLSELAPKDCFLYSKCYTKEFPASAMSEVSACIAKTSMPRYHFTGGLGAFWQREPYMCDPLGSLITRLVALAPVSDIPNDAPSNKWILGYSIFLSRTPPSADELNASTQSPYNRKSESSSVDHLKSKLSRSSLDKNEQVSSGWTVLHKRKRTDKTKSRECWFCLSSKKVEDQLVAWIGNEIYVAMPKGALAEQHVMILPISHEGCFPSLPDSTLDEVANCMDAIAGYYARNNFAVMFSERSLRLTKAPQRHAFLECLPIPSEFISTLEAEVLNQVNIGGSPMIFTSLGPGLGASNAENLKSLKSVVSSAGESVEYIYILLPGGKALICVREGDEDRLLLPLQFARALACRLLNSPEKVEWKNCVHSRDLECSMTENVKNGLTQVGLIS